MLLINNNFATILRRRSQKQAASFLFFPNDTMPRACVLIRLNLKAIIFFFPAILENPPLGLCPHEPKSEYQKSDD